MAKPVKSRPGQLSRADKDFIETFRLKKSVSEIAAQLRRAPEQVSKYLVELGDGKDVRPRKAHKLEDRPEWSRFQDQFDQEDLEFLKYRYDQLMGQFGWDDVTGTEEIQIFQLIELEIMSRQSMAERKPLVTQQKLVSQKLQIIYSMIEDHEDLEGGEAKKLATRAAELEAKLPEISNQLKNINTRHQSYTMQIGKMLENLKGTRDQRIRVATGGNATFLGHLKALQQEEYRRDVGDEMETLRVASEKERKRMAKPHKYMDGMVDQPLLTAETVLESYDEITINEESNDGLES